MPEQQEIKLMLKVLEDNYEYRDRDSVIKFFDADKLDLISRIAQDLLNSLRENQKMTDLTTDLFNRLDNLLLVLEKLSFVYKVELTSFQEGLLHKVNRLDDPRSRDYYLKHIDDVINELKM